MKQIEPQAMLERIRPRRLCYLQECVDLSLPEKIAQLAIQCYASEDESCLAVTWNYPTWNVASFIGHDKEFTREVLVQFKETEAGWSLPPGETLPEIKLRGLKKKAAQEGFAYKGPLPNAPIDPHIQLLEKEQFDLLRAIGQGHGNHDNLNHMPHAFAWMENGQPLGYLSCGPAVEDIWDVGLIFTLPECRGRGIAGKLAYAYLKTMRERGLVPYYSGVTNPHSAGAARKAGFQLCCTGHLYSYKRPKFKP